MFSELRSTYNRNPDMSRRSAHTRAHSPHSSTPRGSSSPPQLSQQKQQKQQGQHRLHTSARTVRPIPHLVQPQTEASRLYYESLIWRGISLLQPHSVLYIAETYHSWFHNLELVDVAGSILQQTVGKTGERTTEPRTDMFDVRSIYWLALCHWHLGEVSAVYALLSPVIVEIDFIIDMCDSSSESVGRVASAQHQGRCEDSPQLKAKKALACSLWLLSVACTRLEKWQEAEDNLESLVDILKLVFLPDQPGSSIGADIQTDVTGEAAIYAVPTIADTRDMLGMVCLRTNRTAQSEEHSLEAVRRNPLLWSACRRVCDLGSGERLVQLLDGSADRFSPDGLLPGSEQLSQSLTESGSEPLTRVHPNRTSYTGIPGIPPGTLKRPSAATRTTKSTSARYRQSGTQSTADILTRTRANMQTPMSSIPAGPNTRSRSHHIQPASSASLSLRGPTVLARGQASRPAASASASASASVSASALARASRSKDSSTLGQEKKRTRNGAMVKSISLDQMREPVTASSKSRTSQIREQKAALAHMFQLVVASSRIYSNAMAYRTYDAIQSFSQLPAELQNSALGLCLLGRICFEAGRFPEAYRAFSSGHHIAPHRVRDMDIYSTLLWHMKREESLAQLAHDTISIGRTWSPEAWITVANCFSLDGDHQSALKSLRRSIQLYKPSPGLALAPRIDSGSQGGLAYAYTLSGHESTASDELDRAQQSFRTAVRVDSRHCNAWHGLGTVYLRLGKVDLAEYHFKRALSLNNQNPLLLQSAAAVFEARKDNQQALATYERIECMMQPVTVGSNRKGKEVDEEDGGHIGLGAVPTEQGILVGGLGSHHALNFVMFKRARILMILERYDEAAAVFECLLRRCPHEFNVPFLLGQAYTHLRRYREAAACLTRALDIAPENAPNVRELFDSLYQHHSPDEQGGSGAQNAAAGPQHEAAPDRTPDNKFTEHDPMVSTPQGSSPYFQSPALYAGRRGEQEWRQDWQALDNASDRVDRVLRFDLE